MTDRQAGPLIIIVIIFIVIIIVWHLGEIEQSSHPFPQPLPESPFGCHQFGAIFERQLLAQFAHTRTPELIDVRFKTALEWSAIN